MQVMLTMDTLDFLNSYAYYVSLRQNFQVSLLQISQSHHRIYTFQYYHFAELSTT